MKIVGVLRVRNRVDRKGRMHQQENAPAEVADSDPITHGPRNAMVSRPQSRVKPRLRYLRVSKHGPHKVCNF
jgi:hypothetical protein